MPRQKSGKKFFALVVDGERNALRFSLCHNGDVTKAKLIFYLILHGGASPIKSNNSKDYLINEEIGSVLRIPGSKIVRVVGPDGEQLGLISYAAALNSAYDRGLDLVLIAQQADPPVCRIMDYGRFKFERDKKEKEAKKKQQVIEIKEIQLSCHIDIGDFNTKGNHARRFLSEGNKVKVIVKFRGRQMAHTDIGRDLLDRFAEYCAEYGTIEKPPVMEGRAMIMFLAPIKAGTTKSAAKPKSEAASDTAKDAGEDDTDKTPAAGVQERE